MTRFAKSSLGLLEQEFFIFEGMYAVAPDAPDVGFAMGRIFEIGQ